MAFWSTFVCFRRRWFIVAFLIVFAVTGIWLRCRYDSVVEMGLAWIISSIVITVGISILSIPVIAFIAWQHSRKKR